jgi:RNA polymerase sigma-70 factor (ECF subfamily)
MLVRAPASRPPSADGGGDSGAGGGSPPHESDSDIDLVRRMRARDERALGTFYDRWFPLVHALMLRMLKSAEDVEDIVEETFWQVGRQADRFTPDRGSVQTWVLTIARSRALDRLRSTRRLRAESIDEVGEAGAGGDETFARTDGDPSVNAEQAERRGLVVAALAELPAEQREALELAYFGGLSQSEIAERTSQPLGTVKTRMRLALQKLRDRLSVLRDDER